MTDQDFDFSDATVTEGTMRFQACVYIVMAGEGEYADRSEWIAGVYLTRDAAEFAAATARKLSDERRVAWQDWYTRLHGLIRHNQDASTGITKAGPEPDSWEADEFAVIEVPIGQHGQWQAFVGE